MKNRGRFQAQGQYLEESENWAQDEPLYSKQAKIKLAVLNGKLSSSERNRREQAFKKCEDFIVNACRSGGIQIVDKPVIKSYPGKSRERVDIEVIKGEAFLKRDEETC
jgi:TolB-like protein